MVVESLFGRLKPIFGCLRRATDIKLCDFPQAILSCFVLHNFCKVRGESISQYKVEAAYKYDGEFQLTYGI